MTEEMVKRLSEIRENAINNKEKNVTLMMSIQELSCIILGMKMSVAYDSVIDEELEIKHERGRKKLIEKGIIQQENT